jgi:hypothetical protein
MRLFSSAASVAALLLFSSSARADPQCTTVAAFNDLMAAQNSFASSAILTFNVTGVNLDDYTDGKGWLSEMKDGSCSAGAQANIKVYGTTTIANPAHPAGTVKLEHGSMCCTDSTPCGEHWSEPNPGPQIFTGPAQLCAVKMIVSPTNVGYDIQCDLGTHYLGDSENADALKVNKIALLAEVSGGHAMPNASASSDQVCFELAPAAQNTQKIGVLEDVTVSPETPNQVYAPETDLSCGATDGRIYLKFPVAAPLGKVKSATLFLRSGADSSSAGDGGDLYFSGFNSWSEKTLTYADAPPYEQPSLGRIGPVVPDMWYSVDVTSALPGKGTYSFALVPRDTDLNGAHFLSKEAPGTFAPYLMIEYTIVDADNDGYPDGPDCLDTNAAVHPGATEVCNYLDDNCDGVTDPGCFGEDAGGGGASADGGAKDAGTAGSGNGSHAVGTDPTSGGGDDGCSCSAPGAPRGISSAWVVLLALLRRKRSCAS